MGYQQLAEDGFAVLGERLRSGEERAAVAAVLQQVLGAQLDMPAAYERRGEEPLLLLRAALEADAAAAAAAERVGEAGTAAQQAQQQAAQQAQQGQQQRAAHSVADVAALRSALGGVVWTASMRRM